MKTNNELNQWMKACLLGALTLLYSSDVLAQSTTSGSTATQGRESRPTNAATNALTQPMMQMVNQMKSARKTDDPDMDYAALAKIHHQTEIDLLQQGINNGKNQQLVSMLRGMVPQKASDMQELNRLSKELTTSSPNQSFAQEISQKVTAMDMDMQKGMNGRMTGDFDKDFVATMIQHHQDGIDLSQSYLKYAKNPTLRTHAERMVANSRKEIDAMKNIIK